MDIETKFWSYVDKFGEVPKHLPDIGRCWQWIGGKDSNGYGEFYYNGKKGIKPHRFSWKLHNGAIPSNKMICHHCDNPSCVNPDHLFLGTHSENMMDMLEKGRAAKKLTAKQVIEIRSIYKEKRSYKAVAVMFGVTEGCIYQIIKRRIWKHI